MPGFRQNLISEIVRTLRDRYHSGFPILKELIQNADDAVASQIIFGHHPGFADSIGHPLLSGPALWIFNNGNFKKSDGAAIASFGINTKAGDDTAIGKFGLGMKSVFHLCEAFFYLAFDGQECHKQILNPWFSDSQEEAFHNSWENISDSDWSKLSKFAETYTGNQHSWFLMWIPLRKEIHKRDDFGNGIGVIVERFPGESGSKELQFLKEDKLDKSLGSILPLLKHLTVIEHVGDDVFPGFKIEIKAHGEERLDHRTADLRVSGNVFGTNSAQAVIRFSGVQICPHEQNPIASHFERFRALHAWPKSYRFNEQHQFQQVSDKSKAEAAVVLQSIANEAGHLTIDWAVFLPVEEGENTYRAIIPGSSNRYQFILHGQFFVDAGRRGINGYAKLNEECPQALVNDIDESGLAVFWNQALAQKLVLPSILLTLSDFVSSAKMPDEEISLLTEAIQNARSSIGQSFFRRYGYYLCQLHSWVCVITETGRNWELIPVNCDRRLLPLPKAPIDDPQRPWKVLPGLEGIANAIFIDDSRPRLTIKDSTWNEASLACALSFATDGDLSKTFGTQTGLEYLASFLELETRRYVGVESTQDVLFGLIQRALRVIPLTDIRKNRERFRSVVQHLRKDRRVSIGTTDPNAVKAVSNKILPELFAADTKTVLLPRDIDPTGEYASSGEPDNKDLTVWLKVINRLVTDDTSGNVEGFLEAADYLLKLRTNDSERAELLRLNKELRVIRATCPIKERRVACNLATLLSLQQRGNLFVFSGGTSLKERLGFVPLLAKALPDEELLVIDSETGKILRESGSGILLQSSNQADGLRCIGGKFGAKVLGAEAERLALIKKVHEGVTNEETRRGLRYLLHGSANNFLEDSTSLWIEPRAKGSPWIKIWSMIDQAQWNILSTSLANSIPPDLWEEIGIKAVEPKEVISKLQEVKDLSIINGSAFSEQELDLILATIEDRELWCVLPLHRDITGALGAIQSGAYYQTELPISQDISSYCRVITLSRNAQHEKNQKEFIRPFDANAIIETVLAMDKPEASWTLILDQLASKSPEKLNTEVLDSLKTIKWLPLQQPRLVIAPEDVIDLVDLDDEIDRLASLADYCYCGVNSIDETVRKHPGFNNARCLFSNAEGAAKQLGLLLGEIQDYHVGCIRQVDAAELPEILPFVDQLGMPGWSFIKHVCTMFNLETVCAEILPNIQRPIAIDKVVSILNRLSNSTIDHSIRINWFLIYLKLFATYPRNEAVIHLHSICLPTRSNFWRKSSEICDGAIGIDHSYLLDPKASRILATLIVSVENKLNHQPEAQTDTASFKLMVSAAPRIIEHYFESWESLVRHPTVGAFIATLGTQFSSLAERWLHPHSLDNLYDLLGWKTPGARDDGARGWMQGVTATEAFGLLTIGICEIEGDSIVLPNLFGDDIQVLLESNIQNLIAGGLYWKGGYSVEIRIRKIPDLNTRSSSELSEILRKTTEYLLRQAYAQSFPDLRALWEQLEESDQLELSVARALILDNLPIVLRQIGAQKKHPALDTALKRYDKARRAKTEFEQSAKNSLISDGSFNKTLRESLEKLASELVNNQGVQAGVLSAVRDKLRDYQYDQSGILFELFQNADDATVELKFLLDDDASIEIDTDNKFVVDINDRIIRVCHWGRPINYCPPAIEDNRADEFRRDLEKMLILSASDKSPSSGVTGKFGLGFKSVLLASDTPRILSGDLKFEIIGGVLPENWQDSSNAAVILKNWQPHKRRSGTLTEIPLNENTELELVTERFASMSGLLAIFAKSIRDIRIIGLAKQIPKGSWLPDTTIGNFEIGKVDVPSAAGWRQTRVLVFRGDQGSVVFRVGSRGVEKFDGAVPSVWVMAPTRESDNLGFVVNAGFDVDAGRSRLASNSSYNHKLAERLGTDLGRTLAELFAECSQDWGNVRDCLHLAVDLAQTEFWNSFWRTLLQKPDASESGISKLAQTLILSALRSLVRVTKCVPNGMEGQWAKFLSTNVTWVSFPTSWWRSEAVLTELAAWSAFTKIYPSTNWIADDFANLIGDFSQNETRKLSVKALLNSIEWKRCDPATSICLHKLSTELLKDVSWSEQFEASASFADLLFISKAGTWMPASSLVSSQLNGHDENIIAGFAPLTHLLDDDYEEKESLAFFLRCRNSRSLRPQDIAEFILGADDNQTRRSALIYLGQGQSAKDVAILIRMQLTGSWLEHLDRYLELVKDLPNETRLEIRLRLFPESLVYTGPIISPNSVLDGDEKLAMIASWWEEIGRQNYLERYQQQFWPQNVSRNFEVDPIDRRAWMTLFGLGLMQRFGRVKDSQNRGFIQSLDDKGWWNVFCNVNPDQDGVEKWINVLKEYGEKQIYDEEYSLWMDNFARLFRIAHWLEMYVHVFRTIDQRAENEFGPVLSPSADSIFQGDDEMSAPSLNRSLNKGQNLIIRELLRIKLLDSYEAKRRAFIPSFGVRQLFVKLGYEEPESSEDIYQILVDSGLDDPTFGGDFDIPLRIIAYGEVALEMILEEK